MGARNVNKVKGSASVIGMINEVHGDATIQGDGVPLRESVDDLPALLDALHEDIAASSQRGEIDDADAEAFVAELDNAKSHLPLTDEKSRSGFLVAMKRARGLVVDLADLAAKVGGAISAVQGIQ